MKKFIFVTFLCAGSFAVADEGLIHQHGAHSECALPKNTQDVIRCVMTQHPQSRRAILESEQSQLLKDKAKSIPNPEFDVESTYGKGSASITDIGLMQPIEWGGKRSSRIAMAESEIAKLDSEARLTQAQVIIETVKNLHRLRQLEQEKKVFTETVETLQKLVDQQVRRPSLAPEQQVTLSVFRMALSDAKIKESEMYEEERSLEHFFHIATGHSLAELLPVLPPAPLSWPDVNEKGSPDSKSPAMMRVIAERGFALAEASAARSEAWPSLRLGPAFKQEQNGEERENLFGFRLTMDLPVFSLNGGSKAYANAGVKKTDKLIELTHEEESHERTVQVKVYRSAVTTLGIAPSVQAIEKEFNSNKKLAARGLISGPLVIEFHRQRADLIRSRHGRELKAIEALWQIYKFDGRIFQESL